MSSLRNDLITCNNELVFQYHYIMEIIHCRRWYIQTAVHVQMNKKSCLVTRNCFYNMKLIENTAKRGASIRLSSVTVPAAIAVSASVYALSMYCFLSCVSRIILQRF